MGYAYSRGGIASHVDKDLFKFDKLWFARYSGETGVYLHYWYVLLIIAIINLHVPKV